MLSSFTTQKCTRSRISILSIIQYKDGLQYRKNDANKGNDGNYPYTPGTFFQTKYKSTKYGTIDPNANRFP